MTDTSNLPIDSPSSVSSSPRSVILDARPSTSKASINRRRSQRRRTHVQPPMRSSALPTTILHESGHSELDVLGNITDPSDLPLDTPSPSALLDDLVFKTTTATSNSKSSSWLVTDRQAEWYKLSIPVQPSTSNPAQRTIPFKALPNTARKKKLKTSSNTGIIRPTDTTQLIMKAVMHELDYDMDDSDLQFLHQLNRQRKSTEQRPISEDEFENAMIILEFSTAENIRVHLKQKCCEDQAIVCDICLLPDADDGNEMVFCERCNTCVHQNCYGISAIPTGTWFCQPCSILRRPACLLCPKTGGPMKPTSSGTIWCHLTCALWLPELKFVDYAKMEPILNLHQISHARWSLRCVVCSTTEGACVQCAHKNCRTPFHVTCALAAGYFLDVQQTSSKESARSRSQFNAYCQKHSDEARQHSAQATSSMLSRTKHDNIDDDDSSSSSSSSSSSTSSSSASTIVSKVPLTVYRRDQLKREQWIHDCYAKFSSFVSSSHLYEECAHSYDRDTSQQIYEYWTRKRQMQQSKPLIERINFVLEQREGADLLIAQINHCLTTQKKMRQLQSSCQAVLNSSSPSTLTQRLQSIKDGLTVPTARGNESGERRGRRHRSSSTSHSLYGQSNHEQHTKSIKRRRQKFFYSTEHYEILERAKRCTVSLESTYRHDLEPNTTYLIGKTVEGQMFLLSKQLADSAAHQKQAGDNVFPAIDYSDVSDDEDSEYAQPSRKSKTFRTAKNAYTSQGNIVTCVTGSFN